MLTGVLAFSQNRVVTGTVIDEKGNGIPRASIKINGSSSQGVSATSDGVFSLRAKQGDKLTVSNVNFESQVVTVGASSNLGSIILLANKGFNDLVVVTSVNTGIQKRNKDEFTGTATTIKAKDLTVAKPVNLQNGLTGKVVGLNVTTTNSGVFGDTRLTIRGNRSLTGNNQPMLVVDGVPISLGFLNSLNPNDIVDVTTLKSSSSTAIYGPDGVNGAIIVTTRKGTTGPASITLSHTVQLEKVSFLPKFQTNFGAGSSVDIFGQGVYDGVENQGYGDLLDGSVRQLGRTGPNGEILNHTYIARPNEKKDFFNTGVTNQTDLSFVANNFYLSAQHVNINGILPKDQNRRISLKMSASRDITPKLNTSFTMNYVQGKYNVNAGGSFGNGRDYLPYWNVINTPINVPLNDFKNWQTDYFASPNGFYNDYYSNPYWAVDNFRSDGRSNDVISNLQFNYKLSPSINLTYRLGGTFTNATDKSTSGALTYSAFAKSSGKNIAASGDRAAGVIDNSSYSTRVNSELFATYSKQVKKFSFELLAGQSYRETNSQATRVSSTNLGIPSVFNISVRKGEPSASESDSKTKLERYFGKLSIGFNKWAYVDFTGSYDRDSRLANPNNYQSKDIGFFYPSVAGSMVLSNAIPAIKNSNLISFLKVRGAVSRTGNVNLGAYSLENTFSQVNGFPYGTLIGFSANDVLRQSTYKPEFVNNKEVGLEIALLKNKINFEGTAYTQNNTNQIITVAYSAATGYPSSLLNAAAFTNKGIELELKLTPLVKLGKYTVNYNINYSIQDSKVTKLIDGVDELGIGNGNYVVVNSPAYVFKVSDYNRDPQGRVIVDANGLPTQADLLQQFGRTTAKNLLGMTLSVARGNFGLSATAEYRGGNLILSDIGSDLDFTGLSLRSAQNQRQRFLFPNSSIETSPGKFEPNTSVYTTGGYDFWSKGVNTNIDANYLSSGAFWKLREIALTYSFPKELFSDSKAIKGATVSFSGRNLLTWLPKTNQWTDPEFSNTTGNAQGVNTIGNNPPSRVFGANVTLNF
jgi:TonB-linked SusC/RagA family outer membrane protein